MSTFQLANLTEDMPLVLARATGVVASAWDSTKQFLLSCLEWIGGLDPFLGALSFVVLYVLATVLFLPGLILTMAAGFLFGVPLGTLYVSIASVSGASLAFLIGRYLARDRLAEKLAGKPRFRAIDRAVSEEGAKVVFLLRLSPVIPFNLLNYALGLTGVTFGRYVLASWIGMLPGTVMYVYGGSLAGSLASVAAREEAEKSTAEWVLFGAGLVATVAVTVFLTKLARRALNRRLESVES